jgi:hypothetical protein
MANLFTWTTRRGTVLTEAQRITAHYVIGEPGVGKSRHLESLIKQDIEAGLGVSVVDVAGGLYQRLEAWLAARPHLWHRVVLIDPQHPDYIVRINPLATIATLKSFRSSEFFRSMMVELWEVDVDDAPRMSWAMANTFQAMSALGLTLVDLRDFLLSKPFREHHLARLPPELANVRSYFATEFGRAQGGPYSFSLPMLSRTGPLTFDIDIRLMHAGAESLDFRSVLDEGLIVLANLPKGVLSPQTSSLVAAFLVARFQQAAISRADTLIDDAASRRSHYLYLDEFQNYTTSNIVDILAESRQFKLRLVMANQFLNQLSEELRSGVLATAGVVTSMRVGFEDARGLAPVIFPRDDYFCERKLRYRTVGNGLAQSVLAEWDTKPYGWDKLAQVLANQPDRWLWTRRKGPHEPHNLQTHDMPDVRLTPRLQEQILAMREACGKRYGVPRELALRELQAQEDARAAMRAAAKAKEADKPKRGRGRPRKTPISG